MLLVLPLQTWLLTRPRDGRRIGSRSPRGRDKSSIPTPSKHMTAVTQKIRVRCRIFGAYLCDKHK